MATLYEIMIEEPTGSCWTTYARAKSPAAAIRRALLPSEISSAARVDVTPYAGPVCRVCDEPARDGSLLCHPCRKDRCS
jgi:hypothetical protein